jgi:hypothetical protein
MGMFDYVVCEAPLPDGWAADELQTKDFDCTMTTLRISAEGRLLIERYESYTVPKEDRPYPDAEEGDWREIVGMWGKRNKHWEDLNFHGEFNFYGNEGVGERTFVPLTPGSTVGHYRQDKLWHEYNARFTDGRLVRIDAIHEDATLLTDAPNPSPDTPNGD